MAINIATLFREKTQIELQNYAAQLGISQDAINRFLDFAIPTLVENLVARGNTEPTARRLLSQLDLMTHAVTTQAEQAAGSGIELQRGADILKQLLGDKLSSFVDQTAAIAGINPGNAASLTKYVAQNFYQFVANMVSSEQLDAERLRGLLVSQDAASSEDEGTEATSTNSPIAMPIEHAPAISRILPWIVLLLTSLAVLYFIGRGATRAAEVNDTDDSGISTDQREAATKVEIVDIVLPSGQILKAPSGQFTAMFNAALSRGGAAPASPFVLESVRFEPGTATLVASSKQQLDQFAIILKEYPSTNVRIEGHTDNNGNAQDNLTLSHQRSLAVKAYLQDRGLESERMRAMGRGQTKPVVSNATPDGQAQNRRVEVYIMQ